MTTTHSWTTTDDVPANAWAAMVSDMGRVLAVTERTGAAVTGPTGAGQPLLTDEQIAFRVQASSGPPVTVRFQRPAGTGSVATTSPITGGLVLTALNRAARHWGALLTWESDADVRTGAVAVALIEGLFGAEDRALSGAPGLAVASQVRQIVDGRLAAIAAAGDEHLSLADYLGKVAGALLDVQAGTLAALQLLGTP